jgi:hypothetical protein
MQQLLESLCRAGGRFLIGFVVGSLPAFIADSFISSTLGETVSMAIATGVLFGALSAVFGRRMLDFLINLWKDGC